MYKRQGLRWSDIDWRQRALHIRRNVVKLSGQPILVKEPKTRAGGTGGISVERTLQTASCLAKRKCVGERTAWWRGTGGRGLSVPAARRGSDGAGAVSYTHLTRMSLMSDPLHIASRLLWLVPPPFWEHGKERDGWFCCYSTRRETGLFSPYSAPLFSVSIIYSFKRV